MIKPFSKYASPLLLSVSLAAAIFSAPFGARSVYAEDIVPVVSPEVSAAVQLSGPTATVVNENFNVNVSLTGAAGDATAGKFIFEYDQTLFDYIQAASANPAVSIAGENKEAGKVTIVATDTAGSLTQTGAVLSLTFKAKAAIDISGITGFVELGLSDRGTVQTPEQALALRISGTAPGDLNGNSFI
ncbi:hypothetical protein K0U00_36225, partial [Paenibacillus sepulcri]|nr:hypothetical protein [Paenibacillus sepulcri]